MMLKLCTGSIRTRHSIRLWTEIPSEAGKRPEANASDGKAEVPKRASVVVGTEALDGIRRRRAGGEREEGMAATSG